MIPVNPNRVGAVIKSNDTHIAILETKQLISIYVKQQNNKQLLFTLPITEKSELDNIFSNLAEQTNIFITH